MIYNDGYHNLFKSQVDVIEDCDGEIGSDPALIMGCLHKTE